MEPTQLIELTNILREIFYLAGIRGALSLKKQDLQDHKWQDDQDDEAFYILFCFYQN